MDSNEALKTIDEIHGIIHSSNRAIFSGERMILTGILIALVPVIEWATQYLTFGHDFGTRSGMWITLIHTAFYWGLFALVGRIIPFKRLDRASLHPLIQKAFSISKVFMVAVLGLVVVFSAIEQGQLIHPIILILLGFLFSTYGRFSIPQVTALPGALFLRACCTHS